MNKKNIIIKAIMIIIVLAGGIGIFLFLNHDDSIVDLETSKNIEVVSNDNLEEYVGYWYENEKNAGFDYLHVTNAEFQTITFDLVFQQLRSFKDITVTIQNSEGTFEYTDGEQSLKGNLSLYDNCIIIYITESTYSEVDIDSTYRYNFHTSNEYVPSDEEKEIYLKEGISTSYVGTWYIGKDHSFQDSLLIYGIDGLKVRLLLSLNGVTFQKAEITFHDQVGSFEFRKNDEEFIKGKMKLEDNQISLSITESNISEIEKQSSYVFTYQSKYVSYEKYVNKWYSANEINNNHYLEIKAVTNDMIVFDWIIVGKAQLRNVAVDMNHNVGTFSCKSTSDEREIHGNFILENDGVHIYITNSTVDSIVNGSVYNYVYKGDEINGKDNS